MAFGPINNPFLSKLRDKIVDTGRGIADGFSKPLPPAAPRRGRSSWELSDATVKPASQLTREATRNNRSVGMFDWLPGALSLAGGALNVGDQVMAHQFRNLGPARKALFEPQLPDGSDPIRQHGIWGNIAVGLQGVDDAGAAYTELTKRPDYKAASDLVLDREMRGDGSSWVNDQYRQERQPLSKRITHPGFSDMRDAKMLLTESPEDRRRRQLAQQGSDERNWGERFLQSIPGVGPIFQAPSIGETVSDAGFGPDASMFADIALSPQNIMEAGVALGGKAAKRLNKVAKASNINAVRRLSQPARFDPASIKQSLYDAAVDVAPVPSSWKAASRERLNAPLQFDAEEQARIAAEAAQAAPSPTPQRRTKSPGSRVNPNSKFTYDKAFNEFQDQWDAAQSAPQFDPVTLADNLAESWAARQAGGDGMQRLAAQERHLARKARLAEDPLRERLKRNLSARGEGASIASSVESAIAPDSSGFDPVTLADNLAESWAARQAGGDGMQKLAAREAELGAAPSLAASIDSAMGDVVEGVSDIAPQQPAPSLATSIDSAMEDAIAPTQPQRSPDNLLAEGATQGAEGAALSAVDDGGGFLPARDPAMDAGIAAQAEPIAADAAQAASGAVVPGDAAPVGRVAKRGGKQKKVPWWARTEEPVYPKYQNLQGQNRDIPAEVEFVAPSGEPFTPAEKAARTEFAATRNAWAVANGENQTPIPDHFWGSWERDQAEKMNSASPTSDPGVIMDRNNAITERRWKIQDAANRGSVDEVRELISAPIVSTREQALSNIRNHIRMYGGFPLDFGAAGKFIESEMRSLGDAIGTRAKGAYNSLRENNYWVRDLDRKIGEGVKWGHAAPAEIVDKAHNVIDAIGGYMGKLTDEIVPQLAGQDPSAARHLLDESSRNLIASSLGVARDTIDGLSKSELQGLRNLVAEPSRVRRLTKGANAGMMRLGDAVVDVDTYNRLDAMAQGIVRDLQKLDVVKTESKQFFQIDNDRLANALGITKTGVIDSGYAKPGLRGYETTDLTRLSTDTGMSPEQLIAAGIATPEVRPVNTIIDQEFGREVVDNLGTYFPEMFGFFESGANKRLQGKTIDDIMSAVDTAGMSAEEVRDLRLLFEQYRDKTGAVDGAGRMTPADRTASERFLRNKDLSPAVKQALREITDPGYAAAKAMYQAKHVVEHTKLRRAISAERSLSLPIGETPQTVNEAIRAGGHPHYNSLLDERDFELLPDDKSRFGALAGRYVNRDVSGFMKTLYGARDYSSLTKATSALSSIVRSSKTVLNPGSHAHQLMSNAVVLDVLEGVGDPARALKAMLDEASVLKDKTDPMYKMARDNGVFAGGQFRNDVLDALGDANVFGDWGDWGEGGVLDSLGPIGAAVDGLKAINNKAGDLWEMSDNVTKMAAFRRRFGAIKRANQAMSDAEVAALAARSVKDNFLDYSKSSKLLRMGTGKPIGNGAIDALSWLWMPLGMFGTYSAMMAPKVGKMALGIADNHWMPGTDLGKLLRFWKYPVALEALHAVGAKMEGLTDKQAEATRPEWAHSSVPGSFVMLPAKAISKLLPPEVTGLKIFDPNKRYWFDTTMWLPWGDFARAQVDEGGSVRNSKIPNPFAILPGGGGVAEAVGNPFVKTAFELMENKESFSGRKIYKEEASTPYRTRQQIDYAYRQLAPNLAPGIPGVTGPLEASTLATSGGASASKLLSGAYNTAADLAGGLPHVPDYRGRDRTLPLAFADAVAGAKAFPSSAASVAKQRHTKYSLQLRDIKAAINKIPKSTDSAAVKRSELRHLKIREKAIRAAMSRPAPEDSIRFAPTIREQILDKMW